MRSCVCVGRSRRGGRPRLRRRSRHRGRDRARQPAPPGLRLARRPVRGRGRPRRHRPVLHRRRRARVHGRDRRGDEDRPLGPQSRIATAWPRWPTRPATTARSARTAIIVTGPRPRADHQRRADGAQGRGRQPDLARDARGREPRRQPVRQGPADHSARQRGPARRHLGLRAPTSTRTRRSATRDRLQPRRPARSTATGSSSPTRAATRSTPSIRGRVENLTVFANRWSEPVRPSPRSRCRRCPPRSRRARRQYYVGQLTGFPFPVGGANVYPTRRRQHRSRVASRTSWTWPSGATARCTCSRSTTTACSRPANEGAIFADPAPRRGAADQAAGRHAAVPRRPHGRRTTASTSRSTRARPAAGRWSASAVR